MGEVYLAMESCGDAVGTTWQKRGIPCWSTTWNITLASSSEEGPWDDDFTYSSPTPLTITMMADTSSDTIPSAGMAYCCKFRQSKLIGMV